MKITGASHSTKNSGNFQGKFPINQEANHSTENSGNSGWSHMKRNFLLRKFPTNPVDHAGCPLNWKFWNKLFSSLEIIWNSNRNFNIVLKGKDLTWISSACILHLTKMSEFCVFCSALITSSQCFDTLFGVERKRSTYSYFLNRWIHWTNLLT